MESQDALGHIHPSLREKVRADLASHLLPDGRWDYGTFNPQNDYQRHLLALFLKLSDWDQARVRAAMYEMAQDVNANQRAQYAEAITHSNIVGFPLDDKTPVLEVVA